MTVICSPHLAYVVKSIRTSWYWKCIGFRENEIGCRRDDSESVRELLALRRRSPPKLDIGG